MFRSWFTGARDVQSQPQQRVRTTVVTKETHFEVIGGGAKPIEHDDDDRHSMALTRPRLPMEIVTEIVFIAARLALQDDWDEGASSSSPSSSALRLASVNTLAYDAIVGNLLLRDLILTGVEQVEAFAASLRRNRRLARLAAVGGKVKTLAVVQATPGGVGRRRRRRRPRRDEEEVLGEQEPRRDSLYDVRLRDKTFAKGILVPLRSFILPLTARSLQELHVESLPTAILPPTGAARLSKSGGNLSLLAASRSMQEVTFTLSPWGGASIQDVFVTPAPAPTPPHATPTAWSQLHSIQVHGSEGFRFCLPSAIALSSLPSLKHLALVMPSSSSAGGLEEALRLLVALTAGKLETLLLIGHDMENWAGWAGPYGVALRSLRVPARGGGKEVERSESAAATRVPLRIKHVTARLQRRTALPSTEGQQQQQVAVAPTVQHPSYYRSWIVARTTEGMQWDWSSGEGGAAESPSTADGKEQGEGAWTCHRSSPSSSMTADEAFGVEWRCDEWDVPAEVEDEDKGERATEVAEYGVGRQATAGDERRREVLAAA